MALISDMIIAHPEVTSLLAWAKTMTQWAERVTGPEEKA